MIAARNGSISLVLLGLAIVMPSKFFILPLLASVVMNFVTPISLRQVNIGSLWLIPWAVISIAYVMVRGLSAHKSGSVVECFAIVVCGICVLAVVYSVAKTCFSNSTPHLRAITALAPILVFGSQYLPTWFGELPIFVGLIITGYAYKEGLKAAFVVYAVSGWFLSAATLTIQRGFDSSQSTNLADASFISVAVAIIVAIFIGERRSDDRGLLWEASAGPERKKEQKHSRADSQSSLQ